MRFQSGALKVKNGYESLLNNYCGDVKIVQTAKRRENQIALLLNWQQKTIINVEKSHCYAIFLFISSFCYAQTSPLAVQRVQLRVTQSQDFGSVCVF